MELKCPQCGKWMAVSQEELVIHDCQVVCPQCLAICRYEGNTLVVRDDSDAPYRSNATVETSKRDDSKFCHSCGKQLPSGICFCPYCGADLNAPFSRSEQPEPQPVKQPEPEPVKEVVKPVEEKRAAPEPKPVRQAPRNQANTVEDKLRSMAPHYSSVHPHIRQNGTKPGLAFKLFAYTAIVLLLALLVYIIIAGASIEMPA